jgi:hypothetical protein
MPEQQQNPDRNLRDASWARDLERGRVQQQVAAERSSRSETGAAAKAGPSVDPSLARNAPQRGVMAGLMQRGGREPGDDSIGGQVAELRDDAKRMGSIAAGAATGGVAGAAAGAARAAAEDAQKAAMNVATAKNKAAAAVAEAGKAFKNWAVKPNLFTLYVDFLGPTIVAVPLKLLFLNIYGLLAATGRKGTIKYNIIELLVLFLYNLAFIALIMVVLAACGMVWELVTCAYNFACAVGTVLG